jgi:hypothetical protein
MLVGENYQNKNTLFLPDSHCVEPDPRGMSNPLHPSHMSATGRLAELAEILATGVIRLHAQKSSTKSPENGEISLDLPPDQSGPATNRNRREKPK